MPNPELLGFIAPSAGSSVTAVAPLAPTHLSNDASEPVALPSKMYSKPRSGGGGVYCAPAPAGAASAASAAMPRATRMRLTIAPPLPRLSLAARQHTI
jgi:hypothetical protein